MPVPLLVNSKLLLYIVLAVGIVSDRLHEVPVPDGVIFHIIFAG